MVTDEEIAEIERHHANAQGGGEAGRNAFASVADDAIPRLIVALRESREQCARLVARLSYAELNLAAADGVLATERTRVAKLLEGWRGRLSTLLRDLEVR